MTSQPKGEPSGGLTTDRAHALLAVYGPNRLVPERRRVGVLGWLLRALADPMAALLLVAGSTYLVLRDYVDAAVTFGALVPISAVTLVLERRAEQALAQLKRLTAPAAIVWRDGQRQTVTAETLVPDDIIVLHEGDIIPADATLLEGTALVVDESALTGEAHPVIKDAATEGGDRLLFAGTTLRAGRGTARIAVTGAATRYGRIGSLMARITPPPTPLQRLIRRLIRQLARGAAILCAGVFAIEVIQGRGWAAGIIAGVSLGIAAVPEEFPIVYTLYLALGAWRLARARALIRRLTGVEALGATTVICADKTGTLTLGRMDVAALSSPPEIVRAGDPLSSEAEALLHEAVRASEPRPYDPMDQAILRFAVAHGVNVDALHARTLAHDYPFDPTGKYNSHVWDHNGNAWISAKGAAEGILERSQADAERRRQALEANRVLAAEGFRVIAVAGGPLPRTTGDRAADEGYLRFTGLIAFSDPLRPGVAEALLECAQAGIRVAMITGDHPVTAHAVAEGLGLPHSHELPIVTGEDLDRADEPTLRQLVSRINIFARVRPEQKYRLVQALRSQGEVVAMTGDGVNDAPALREADVGVAMGERGTEVAREAATIVLLDDNFATLIMAIREGRRIFDDLRRAFTYLIAFHTPILLAALTVPLLGAPLLLLPLHLVWLELIVHPTASLVFEYDPPAPDLMRRPPRHPEAGLVDSADFLWASATGVTLCGGVLWLYLWGLGHVGGEAHARGIALAALLLGQIILVLSARSPTTAFWRAPLSGNRVLPPVLGVTVASLAVVLYVPPLASILHVAPPSAAGWVLAAGVAGATTFWHEMFKTAKARRGTPP
ncbi:MAG TPA: cation-transporting P-type ATPase [bacterium]|nr:cation-transporting P-type ATPase [bacterium]